LPEVFRFYPVPFAELRISAVQEFWICKSSPDIAQLGASVPGNDIERILGDAQKR